MAVIAVLRDGGITAAQTAGNVFLQVNPLSRDGSREMSGGDQRMCSPRRL
jgi:hypothetical protein